MVQLYCVEDIATTTYSAVQPLPCIPAEFIKFVSLVGADLHPVKSGHLSLSKRSVRGTHVLHSPP